MKLLFDGWDLIYHPVSASAIHTLELLTSIPIQFQPYLAIPQALPDWLPGLTNFTSIQHDLENNPKNHLIWQQVVLPEIIRKSKASVFHLTHPTIPLLHEIPIVFSPTQFTFAPGYQQRSLFWERLAYAFATGGINRIDRFLFPDDLLPPSDYGIPFNKIFQLPPPDVPFKSIFQPSDIGIPTHPYFLYIGNNDTSLLFTLLDAWDKASKALGDQIHLYIIPNNNDEKIFVEQFQNSDTIHVVNFPPQNPIIIDYMLEHTQALIQLFPEPYWGGFARRALLLGIPIIGFEYPSLVQIVRDAGYLVEIHSERLLSAAIITLIVEEEIYHALRNKAALRQSKSNNATFSSQIEKIYQEIR